MTTMNVTLHLDDQLLARAQALAAQRNMTLSEMLERLLKVVAETPRPEDFPPVTRRTMGVLPPMTDEERKQAIDEQRARKFDR